MLTTTERAERLREEIRRFEREGFWVQARTETSARLIRPKQLNPLVLWTSILLIGIGVLIFIAYYLYFLGTSDTIVVLSVDAEGNVVRHDLTHASAGPDWIAVLDERSARRQVA